MIRFCTGGAYYIVGALETERESILYSGTGARAFIYLFIYLFSTFLQLSRFNCLRLAATFPWKQIVLKTKLISVYSEYLSVLDVGRYIVYAMERSILLKKGAWALKQICSLERLQPETIKQSRFSLYKSSNRSIHKFHRSLTCTLNFFIACGCFALLIGTVIAFKTLRTDCMQFYASKCT